MNIETRIQRLEKLMISTEDRNGIVLVLPSDDEAELIEAYRKTHGGTEPGVVVRIGFVEPGELHL